MIGKERIATAAIIRKKDKILIAQRQKDSLIEPSKWEFPGGKVEPSETYEECLVREIKEELGITISIEKLFLKTRHVYIKDNKKFPIIVMAFLADWLEGDARNIDCQDFKWIDINDLKRYDFVAADIPIVDKLLAL
jgi:mutator protein MutT